jgi:hypothetical protein
MHHVGNMILMGLTFLLLQFCIMRKLVQCGKYFRSREIPPYTSFTVYIYIYICVCVCVCVCASACTVARKGNVKCQHETHCPTYRAGCYQLGKTVLLTLSNLLSCLQCGQTILNCKRMMREYAVVERLRHYATRQKVAGSIPDDVNISQFT